MREGPDGTLRPDDGAAGGGLAPSLAASLGDHREALWVAAARSEPDRKAAAEGVVTSSGSGLSLRLVALDAEVARGAYDVIANGTLWFAFHGLFDAPRRPLFDRAFYGAWEHFRAYNRLFAEVVAAEAAPGAVVLVNDYHLLLAGSALAELRPDLRTVHFTHTPFCPPEELEILPPAVRGEILSSMGSFGACGFHTRRWEEAFCRSAAAFAPRPAPGPTFHVGLGPDGARLAEAASGKTAAGRLAALEERIKGRRLILRSDRIELSKNLLRGFRAYEQFLEESPEWREKVVMVVRAYPSREALPEYLAYRSEVEHTARLVNDRLGTPSWEPVIVDVDDDFASSVAALRRYDVLLVNPIRDGMNLVAKEGPILNEKDGVLVLSELAGAYAELGGAALGIHPFDVSATAAALRQALELPPEERRRRAVELRSKASANPPSQWLDKVLSEARPPSPPKPGP